MNGNESGELWEAIERLGAGQASEPDHHLLFEHYRPLVRGFFARTGVRYEDYSDLTQEVFFRVFSGRGSFKSETQFRAWVLTIARNLLSNQRRERRAKKRDGVEESLSHLTEELLPAGPTPFAGSVGNGALEVLLSKEQAQTLRAEIDRLPPKMRQCMLLRALQEYSYSEIAGLLQISVETVKAHLHQGRQRLRGSLAEPGGSTEGTN
jgi:RNA polymerase sigma-70 factor (ECF subfamily)